MRQKFPSGQQGKSSMENPQSRYFSKCTIFDEVHCYRRNGEKKVGFLRKFEIFFKRETGWR